MTLRADDDDRIVNGGRPQAKPGDEGARSIPPSAARQRTPTENPAHMQRGQQPPDAERPGVEARSAQRARRAKPWVGSAGPGPTKTAAYGVVYSSRSKVITVMLSGKT